LETGGPCDARPAFASGRHAIDACSTGEPTWLREDWRADLAA